MRVQPLFRESEEPADVFALRKDWAKPPVNNHPVVGTGGYCPPPLGTHLEASFRERKGIL